MVQLCRSSNRIDKPYLMLRVSKLVCDTALMEYGPAVQASLGGIQLVDKLHVGTAGEYLELIATEPGTDIISLLYRKVRLDMPMVYNGELKRLKFIVFGFCSFHFYKLFYWHTWHGSNYSFLLSNNL